MSVNEIVKIMKFFENCFQMLFLEAFSRAFFIIKFLLTESFKSGLRIIRIQNLVLPWFHCQIAQSVSRDARKQDMVVLIRMLLSFMVLIFDFHHCTNHTEIIKDGYEMHTI